MAEVHVTRKEHLAWCKQRALEYLERCDLSGAVASMTSDMNKHPETIGMPFPLMTLGLKAVSERDVDAARRWIEGFN